MIALVEANPVAFGIAVVVLLLAIGLLLASRRRTKVTFTDDGEPARRNQALIDSAPVAAQDAATQPVESDLARLKGVGPKLIAQLHELGVTSLGQVAAWDEAEVARIDSQLGRFAGRITRDDWVGQAQLLQSDDKAAYEERFGRL